MEVLSCSRESADSIDHNQTVTSFSAVTMLVHFNFCRFQYVCYAQRNVSYCGQANGGILVLYVLATATSNLRRLSTQCDTPGPLQPTLFPSLGIKIGNRETFIFSIEGDFGRTKIISFTTNVHFPFK